TSHPVSRLMLLAPYFAVRRQWYYILPPEAYLFSIGRLFDDLPRLRLPIGDREMHKAAKDIAFFHTFNLNAVRSTSELIDIVKRELPTVETPTAIVQSRVDSVVDPSGASYVKDAMGDRLEKLVWLDDSDHVITLDRERDRVFAEVSDFLASSAVPV
ncbi:MAG: carboxylesterase, partial [Cyanobacteria bacterium J06648_11]